MKYASFVFKMISSTFLLTLLIETSKLAAATLIKPSQLSWFKISILFWTDSLVSEKFLSNFLEQCGISRERYKTYKSGTVSVPTKKFVIALGLFCEPFCNLFKLEDSNCTIMENLETFMNQHAMS